MKLNNVIFPIQRKSHLERLHSKWLLHFLIQLTG